MSPIASSTRPLDGRVALVTGASRGLGRALALAMANAGANVVLCARGREGIDAVGRELQARGHDAMVAAVDVTDETAIQSLLEEVRRRYGRLDVLINNASLLGSRGPLAAQDSHEWRQVIDVNLTGAFLVTRAALPLLRENGGCVINVSSGVGNRPRSDWGAYAVSKRALEAFSENLAMEERDSGVRVNIVDPGGMRTGMRQTAYPEEDPDTLPTPDAVVGVFLWLAGDEAHAVTGRRFVAQEWHTSRANP